MATQNKKIFHYNFSFAYSADKYLLQGTPLSERSSVLQKFINNTNKITFDDLETYRSEIYEKQLNHLKSILTNGNPDYFGLTELTVQMPNGNHAYSNHLTKKLTDNYFPEGKINEDYGVAKMLKKLGGLIEDKSEVKSVESEVKSVESGVKYDIFYDNIVHINFKFGEGVGMLVKKGLVDNYLEWKGSTRGVEAKLTDKNVEKNLHFWSTDSGYALDGKNLFRGPTGGSDYGRPFIMTAGLKNNTLRIFSNFHGPNLSNLWYSKDLGEDHKPINTKQLKNINNNELKNDIYTTIKKSIEESINKGLENSNLSNVGAINNCEIYFTCDSNDSTGSLLEMILKNGIEVKLKINEAKDNEAKDNEANENSFKVKFNYDQINNLGKEENTKGLGKYKKILTCCANCDSIETGRDIRTTCSKPNPIYCTNDKLNDDEHFKLHYNNGTVNQIQYTGENKNIDENIETYKTEDDKTISPDPNFIDPANYGYNGDYSLYGTSDTSDTSPPLMKMTIYEGFVDDHTIPNTEKNTPLSDHQGIMSEPSTATPTKGGKRRRTRRKNKNKNAKKTNKKGKSKKYRKKGRKTRKIRRRK